MSDRDGPGLRDLLSMGMSLALCVAIGLVAGLYADRVLDTSPVFVLIGLVLSVVGASAIVYGLLRRYM